MDSLFLHKSIDSFLAEDIATGDITSEAIFSPDQMAKAFFVAKGSFLAAGMEHIAAETFKAINPLVSYNGIADGTKVHPGDILLEVTGPVLDLLKAERVALNLVQRLCGIATTTSHYVKIVEDLPVKIVDTRKTTPGLRIIEKYAVRVGGGHNHRFSLSDGVLIKDNHIEAAGSITVAVEKVRSRVPHTLKIEVETENISQVEECIACRVDTILLDNMDTDSLRESVIFVDGRARLEASGGISLKNVRQVAETGVDLISIGALTHSAPSCDISMRIENT